MKLHLPLLLAAAVMAAYVSAPAFAESDYVYNSVGGDPYIYEVGGANPLVMFSKQCAQTLRMEYAYQFLLISDVTTTGWDEPTSTSQYAKGRPLFWDGTLHYFTTHENYTSAEGHTKASLSFKDCEYGLFGAGIRDNHDAKDNLNGAVGNVTFDNLRCLEISGIKAADRTERVLTAERELPGGIIYLDRLDFENTFTITNVSDDDNSTTYDVIFANNTSDRGTIYADYVTLSGNGGINFSANTALKDRGGAIYATKDVSITENTGEILFDSNKAKSEEYVCDGSAIYSEGSVLLGANQGSIIFQNNEGGSTISAINDIVIKDNTGRTIYFSGNNCIGHSSVLHSKAGNILLEGNQGYITFTNNTCSDDYGVICAEAGTVTFKNNKAAININENTACDWKGAAIYSASGVNFEGNEGIYFLKNASTSTNGVGGAIYNESGLVSFSNNEDVNFAYNQATYTGGAIFANGKDDDGVSVSMKGNACVTFDHNEALEENKRWGIGGGAIYAVGSVSLSDNKRVDGTDEKSGVFFTYNTAGTEGGAIYSESTVSLTGNGAIKFDNNTATTGRGGAIRGVKDITITGNTGNIDFTGNTAGTDGGAISTNTIVKDEGDVGRTYTNINGNTGDISFIGNKAAGNGGAIDLGGGNGFLKMNDNNGSITFSGNTAGGIGGAINCTNGFAPKGQSLVSIANNTGEVKFLNNRAGANAGAIHIEGIGDTVTALDIRNNGNVLFEKNAVVDSAGNYQLRSIQMGYKHGGHIRLSAAADKTIEFRDSIDGLFALQVNEAYNGVEQTGDIVFTGAYTEQHLNDLLVADRVNRQATEAEINASRQSTIGRYVAVHGGRLRVEDGAVLSTHGIKMAENAGATLLVKNATVQCRNSDGDFKGDDNINITRGNTLQVEGASKTDDSAALMFTLAEAEVVEAPLNATVGAVLDTHTLTLHSGSSLVLDKSHIDLADGCLTLNMLGEDKINLVFTLDGELMEDSIVNLFSNIGTLKLGAETCENMSEFDANLYFTGSMIGENTKVQYKNGSLTMTGVIPEPTTATLSLLALAGLAARRRRK